MTQKPYYILIFLYCILIFACSETLYVPASPNSDEQAKLISGRNLYIDKCSNCHNLYLPERLSDENWNKKMDTMQVRAKINNAERDLIYHYIISHPKK